MRNVAVCIPTLNLSPLLDELCMVVVTDPSVQYLEIMNNTSVYPFYSAEAKNYQRRFVGTLSSKNAWVNTRGTKGQTIYQMWNEFRRRQEGYRGYLAFLNDDIVILPGALTVMKEALESDDSLAIVYPDVSNPLRKTLPVESTITYTETTAGAGGMTGYCFMMRCELGIPYIDENLSLYWGDDDLVKQTIAAGYKIGQVNGLPIQHIGSHSINKMDPLLRRSMMESDRNYFNQKYGEHREPVA